MIDKQFVEKYRAQYYQDSAPSLPALYEERRKLRALLEELNKKVNLQLDRACESAQLQIATNRKSNSSPLITKLPNLVTEAELKNCQSYRRVLEAQKYKLEEQMQRLENSNKENLSQEITNRKLKIAELTKANKKENREIKKMGEQIVSDCPNKTNSSQALGRAIFEKTQENQKKSAKIQENTQKAQKLQTETDQLEYHVYQLEDELAKADVKQPSTEDTKRYEALMNKVNKLRTNKESINNRKQQEYFCKLKELEKQNQRMEALEKQYRLLKFRVEVAVKEREGASA